MNTSARKTKRKRKDHLVSQIVSHFSNESYVHGIVILRGIPEKLFPCIAGSVEDYTTKLSVIIQIDFETINTDEVRIGFQDFINLFYPNSSGKHIPSVELKKINHRDWLSPVDVCSVVIGLCKEDDPELGSELIQILICKSCNLQDIQNDFTGLFFL